MSTVKFYSWSSSVIAGTSESLNYYWDNVNNAPDFVETGNPAHYGKVIKVRYTPGHSCFYFFRYQGCWFALYRDPQQNRNDPLSRNAENIVLYHFSWSKGALYSLMETIQKVNIDSRRGVTVLCGYQTTQDVKWRPMGEEPERELESLALTKDMKEEILSDIDWFFSEATKRSYERRGIPYRRGYIFYGAPGTGKTSLCRALATKFGLSIHTINLATVDNNGLQELFRILPIGPCLVLLEDIDSAGIKREVSTTNAGNMEESAFARSGINLVTILNTLDGIGAKVGHLLVATTNVLPALDSALTRPGRIDRKFKFENPDVPTIVDYFCHFFGNSNENVAELAIEFAQEISHRSVTPATLQGYFLQCNDDPAKAVANVSSLVPC